MGFILENVVFSECLKLVGSNLKVFDCIVHITIVEHVIDGSGTQGSFLPGLLVSECNL